MRALARLYHGDADRSPPVIGALAVTAAVLTLLVALPYGLNPFYVGVATEILIFGLWATSMNVLTGTAGLVTLGHAGLLGVSVYTIAYTQGRWGWSFWLAALLAVAVTMLVTAALSLTITRASGVYFLMITLAQGMLIWGVAQRWVSVTDGDNGLRGATRPEVFGAYWAYYWFTLGVVLLILLGLRWFLTSSVGLQLRAVKDSPSRLASLGYSVARQKIVAFNVAGLVAAVAGVLYAGWFQFVSPAAVFLSQSVAGLLMVILGGVGYFLGPLVGAATVLSAETALSSFTGRWSTLMGVLLIVTVLYTPAGISGLAASMHRRLRHVPEEAEPPGRTLLGPALDAAGTQEASDTTTDRGVDVPL